MLFLFLTLFCLLTHSKTVDEWLKDGDDAFISSSYTVAQNAYTKALEIEPDNYRAFYKRATVLVQVGKHSEALYDLNQVLQINPSYHLALVTRGKLNKELGKFAAAKQDLETVLEAKRATVKQKAQQELNEIQALEKSMQQGDALLQAEKYAEAKQAFSDAISKAPSWGLPRLARATVSFQAGEYNEVIEDTLRLLKVTKSNVDAILLRGKAFKYMGDLEAAEKHSDNCLLWEPSNTDCKLLKEEIQKFSGTLQSAEKRVEGGHAKLALVDIEACLTWDPRLTFFHPRLYLWQAKAHLKLDLLDDAVKSCDNAFERDSSLNEVFKIKAEVYMAKEDFDEAVRQYEKAVNAGDNSAQEGLQNAKKRQKMAQRKDYYKILGIPKTASAQEIKKAYRKLAMQYHPDKMRNFPQAEIDAAEVKMKDFGEAYGILSDAEKKGKYDRGDDIEMNNHHHWGGHGFPGFQFNFGRRG